MLFRSILDDASFDVGQAVDEFVALNSLSAEQHSEIQDEVNSQIDDADGSSDLDAVTSIDADFGAHDAGAGDGDGADFTGDGVDADDGNSDDGGAAHHSVADAPVMHEV